MNRMFTLKALSLIALLALLPTILLAADADKTIPLAEPQPGTIVYTIIIFFAVLAILKVKAWGPLMKALDERERKIRESLDAAERATEESKRAAKEHEDVLAAARKEASAIVDEGKRDAEVVRDRIVLEAKQGAEELKSRALVDIEGAKSQAVHEIHQRAVELSVLISEKLIQKSLSPGDHKVLIDEAIQGYEKLN